MEELEKSMSVETEPTFKIELPKVGDELALAPMHIQAWKETYVLQESGLTEEKVDELLKHLLINTDFRKKHDQRSFGRSRQSSLQGC